MSTKDQKPGKQAKKGAATKGASGSKAKGGKNPQTGKGKGSSQSLDDDWGKEFAEAIEDLNPQQTLFVMEFAKTRNRVQSYLTAYGGNCTYGAAAVGANRLLKNAKVRRAIRIIANTIIRQYKCDPDFILQELAKLAHVNMDDVVIIEDDGSVVTDLSMADRDIMGAVEHIETEELYDTVEDEDSGEEKRVRVGQKVKIKMVSRVNVLMNLAKIQKMFGDNFSPRAETAKIMKDLREGEIDTLEAAYRFTELGLPLPEVIKIQLTKGIDGGGDDDDKTPKTDEELDARYKEAMAAIKDQRKNFLPERLAEVNALKQELKEKDGFRPAVDPEGPEIEAF